VAIPGRTGAAIPVFLRAPDDESRSLHMPGRGRRVGARRISCDDGTPRRW